MAQTIGQLLRATREGKGMVVEDVAFHTRIHPKIIRNLEADDYSGFANLTYAKGFLKLYSNFVDVDATEVLADFGNTSDLGMAGDYSYLEPMFDRVEGRMKLESNRRANPAMLGIVTALILIPIIGVIYALTRPENPGAASSGEGSGAPANPNPAQPAGVAPADPADGAGDSPGQPADADPVAGADLNDPQGGAIDIKSASEEAERLRQGRFDPAAEREPKPVRRPPGFEPTEAAAEGEEAEGRAAEAEEAADEAIPAPRAVPVDAVPAEDADEPEVPRAIPFRGNGGN